MPLWQAARGAYLVSPSRRLLTLARQRCQPRDIFSAATTNDSRWGAMVEALRPVQWVKNLLVLLPLLLAHKARDSFRVTEAVLAFIARHSM